MPAQTALERFLAEAPERAGRGPTKPSCEPAPFTMASFFMPVPLKHPQLDSKDQPKVMPIARYGRIYKRKRPTVPALPATPCPPGTRYCTHCKKAMPIEAFYTTSKRYICRWHHYHRVAQRIMVRKQEDPFDDISERAWSDMQELATLVGYSKINYDAHDFRDLLEHLQVPLEVDPRFAPIDPLLPMRPRNLAIITRRDFLVLRDIAESTSSRAQHILFVQAVNMVPRHADVGIPWDPFHNPDYRRADIDVHAVLESERANPPLVPIFDVLALHRERAKLPWPECKRPLLPAEHSPPPPPPRKPRMSRVEREQREMIPAFIDERPLPAIPLPDSHGPLYAS